MDKRTLFGVLGFCAIQVPRKFAVKKGRSKREEMYVHIWLIHFTVQQKLMQHCKAIMPGHQSRRVWHLLQAGAEKPMSDHPEEGYASLLEPFYILPQCHPSVPGGWIQPVL